MEPNNDFTSQKEEVEKLKQNRKKKTDNTTAGSSAAGEKTGFEEQKVEETKLTIVKNEVIDQELAKANITEQILQQLSEYKNLTVNGLEDKEGYEKVKTAQTLCRNTRVLTEKICKKGREAAIATQRAWIAKEKEVSEQIEEVEKYLKGQRSVIDDEKARIAAERENAQQIRMQKRTSDLLAFGAVFNGETFELQEGEEKFSLTVLDAKMCDDQQFNIYLLKCEILHEKAKIRIADEQAIAVAERERVEKIAVEQKAESDRLEKARIEQEKVAADLKKQQDELEEQKKELQRQKEKDAEIAAAAAKAKEDADKEKEAALAAAEQKRLDDIAKIEKENNDRIAAEKKVAEDKIAADKKAEEDRIAEETVQKAKAEKEAALRPDKEKLLAFADDMSKTDFYLPKLTSEEGKTIMETVLQQHLAYVKWIRTQAEKLK